MRVLSVFLFLILGILLFVSLKRSDSAFAQLIPEKPTTPISRDSEAFSIRGLTLVAPPEPFTANPMPPVADVGANWIAVVPYGYTMPGKPKVHYNVRGMQWWGESVEGARQTILLAKQQGLRVMLKPQVYVPGGWTGTLSFRDSTEWQAWESDYSAYIVLMAKLAQECQVDLFCIGTEFRTAIAQRPHFWLDLIQQVKAEYSGKLTYSANWDDWQDVPFYNALDYIGLSAYFPLVDQATPDTASLMAAWQPIAEQIATFQKRVGKPVLFTEFGYLSVDGCGWRNWELEPKIMQIPINQQAQANCFHALFGAMSQYPWWHGGFLWKWFPNMRGHEGYPERDYTPQDKLAQEVLKSWYRR